jgi:hypothetical protein
MRTISCTEPGPARLALDLGPGLVHVIVEDRETAELTLTPHQRGDQVAADLIAQAIVTGPGLTITVPRPQNTDQAVMVGAGRGVHVVQSFSSVTGTVTGVVITDDRVHVAGRQFSTGTDTADSSGQVSAVARLPLGSSLRLDTSSANTRTTGHLAKLVFRSTSADLTADGVGRLVATTVSGDVGADRVDTATIETVSGAVSLCYRQGVVVTTTSGDVTVFTATARHQASITTVSGEVRVATNKDGHIAATTVSGDILIKAFGDANVTTRTRTVSGDVRVPRTR